MAIKINEFEGVKCEGCGREHGSTNEAGAPVIITKLQMHGWSSLRCYPCGMAFAQAKKDATDPVLAAGAVEVDPNQLSLL